MNIFVLDTDPVKSIEYHVDQHVVKMPIEMAQMLSTNLREQFEIEAPYKSVYINHPCTRWVGASFQNFMWTLLFGMELCTEYKYRFGKTHAVSYVLEQILDLMPSSDAWGPTFGPIEHPKCVAPQFKQFDVVTAYRLQYLYRKSRLFKWTNRPVPEWIQDTSWTKEV